MTEKRIYFAASIEDLKRNLTIAAKFTKALADSIEDDSINTACTLETLQDVEFISESLRHTIASAPVLNAICKLIDAGVLDADEMEKLGICERIRKDN